MPENRFEKQVREDMEALHLPPSATVWVKVEKELHRKKRRRVIFFFFLLAGLSLLGYSGYRLWNPSTPEIAKHEQAIGTASSSAKKHTATPDKKYSITPAQPDSSLITQPAAGETRETIVTAPDKKMAAPTVSVKPAGDDQAIDKESRTKIAYEPNNNTVSTGRKIGKKNASPEKRNLPVHTEKNNITQTPASENLPVQTDPAVTNLPARQETPELNTGAAKNDNPDKQIETAAKPDNSLVQQADTAIAAADTLAAETTAPVIAGTEKKRRITWGIDLSLGRSTRKAKPLPSGFTGNQARDPLYANLPDNLTSAPTAARVLIPPAVAKAGPAFSIGMIGELPLTPRSRISAGLRYQYQSDRIQIGNYRDTSLMFRNFNAQTVAVEALYAAKQERSYTNHYHFIQLPVSYQLQLNKGKKLPISWEIGGSAGFLFKTNALVYDTTLGGIYYKDHKVFNKFHVSVGTGIAFHFGKKNRQWSVGPVFSLDMTRFMKDAYDPRQYMLYGGISGRLLLPKKKK